MGWGVVMGEVTAQQMPDLRVRLLADMDDSHKGRLIRETYARAVASGRQILADGRIRDPYQQADLLMASERRRLREAALYWVSADMTALTLAAAATMPPFRPTTADLPARSGFVYFAAPLEEFTEVQTVVFADGGPWVGGPEHVARRNAEVAEAVRATEEAAQTTDREAAPWRYQMVAATWGPFAGSPYEHDVKQWRDGGLWMTFYTRPTLESAAATLREAGLAGQITPEEYLRRTPTLRIDNEVALAAHPGTPTQEAHVLEAMTQPDNTASWLHTVLAAFRLMATSQTASAVEQVPPRPVRRRAAQAQVVRPDEAVRLLDVATRPAPPDDSAAPDAAARRNYRVRWVVEGHWRNQWYPSRETHRPKWIDSYVKGPQDAPLQIRDTVHVWREHHTDSSGEHAQ